MVLNGYVTVGRVVNDRMNGGSLTWAKDKFGQISSKTVSKRPNNGCLIYSIGVNANHLGFEMGIQATMTKEAEQTIENYEIGKSF